MVLSRMNAFRLNPLLPSICMGLLFGFGSCAGVAASDAAADVSAQQAHENSTAEEKKIIGPVMMLAEAESQLEFRTRVDTGATSTSIHVEEIEIKDESSEMKKNVGKTIRFRIKNHRGESEWLERKIKRAITVKTSAKAQNRYVVPLELQLDDIVKEVDVTLNNRSHMTYELLLGRNFLQGDFLVDVDLPQNVSAIAYMVAIEEEKVADDSEEATDEAETVVAEEVSG